MLYTIHTSLRQLLRTPVKTGVFLVLIALITAFLTLGGGLFFTVRQNLSGLEELFVTVGFVEQLPVETETSAEWDAERGDYRYRLYPRYGQAISDKTLFFEGSEYIIEPYHRPFYSSYTPGYTYVKDEHLLRASYESHYTIAIIEPLEDCVPSEPVKARLVEMLFGDLGYEREFIWFCDHYNNDPAPMYADKRYVVQLQLRGPHAALAAEYGSTEEFVPDSLILSTQRGRAGERIKTIFTPVTEWDEWSEELFDTPRGQRWLALAEELERYQDTIPVVPTDATHLLLSFYEGNAVLTEGRDITAEEYETGARVCLVRDGWAALNDLSPGDSLPLQLYLADYANAPSRVYSRSGAHGVAVGLTNAEGQPYGAFDAAEYTIVGIYNDNDLSATGYSMPYAGVVIPAASVQSSDQDNIAAYGPMLGYNTSFQIANGQIEAYTEAMNAAGLEGVAITFYDRGYTAMKAGLDNMQILALVLLAAGGAGTVLVLLFFCDLFIAKQKKRTAIERSLGCGKGRCALSLLAGLMLVVALGAAGGAAAGNAITGYAIEASASAASSQSFDNTYSNWAGAGEESSGASLALETGTGPALPIAMASAVLLAAGGIAGLNLRGNLKAEPMALLSEANT